MAQTANCQSAKFDSLQVITSVQLNENNNARIGADDETPGSGFFLSPSSVTGRSADITGFILTSANEYGKFDWSSPASVGGSIALNDLSDVVITTPLNNQRLIYDTASLHWINAVSPLVSQATSITTGVTTNTPSAIIRTQTASTGSQLSTTFTVTNSRVTTASTIVASVQDYSGTFGTAGLPIVAVDNIAAGTFDIVIGNAGSASLSGTLDIAFVIFS